MIIVALQSVAGKNYRGKHFVLKIWSSFVKRTDGQQEKERLFRTDCWWAFHYKTNNSICISTHFLFQFFSSDTLE